MNMVTCVQLFVIICWYALSGICNRFVRLPSCCCMSLPYVFLLLLKKYLILSAVLSSIRHRIIKQIVPKRRKHRIIYKFVLGFTKLGTFWDAIVSNRCSLYIICALFILLSYYSFLFRISYLFVLFALLLFIYVLYSYCCGEQKSIWFHYDT